MTQTLRIETRDDYDIIFSRLEKLVPGLTELKPGEYRKSESSGFMDLHLDVLGKGKDYMIIALSHNFEMNGDLVPDPDMQIKVYTYPDWKKAEALTYQDQFGYREVYFTQNLQQMVNIKAKKELNSFLKQWLKNCLDQGHKLIEG